MVIGGLLHDIGTYFLLKQDGSDGGPLKFDGPNYVRHGLKGYEYLLNEGVDESIAQFARNHTGVGLTKEAVESQGLPLPPADYVPMNLEQEVVMVADKYNSKSIPPKFLTAEAYARKAAVSAKVTGANGCGCSNDTACLTSRRSPSSTTCVSSSRADRFQNTQAPLGIWLKPEFQRAYLWAHERVYVRAPVALGG